MFIDRRSREVLRQRTGNAISHDLLGGANFTMPATFDQLGGFAFSDSGDVPVTQDSQFRTYAVCGIAICGDDSICGP
jgi:hypothetical protein